MALFLCLPEVDDYRVCPVVLSTRWESVTCGRHNLSLEAGLQVFHRDIFPGPSSLQQTQDHLIDDIASKVTKRDRSLLTVSSFYLGFKWTA